MYEWQQTFLCKWPVPHSPAQEMCRPIHVCHRCYQAHSSNCYDGRPFKMRRFPGAGYLKYDAFRGIEVERYMPLLSVSILSLGLSVSSWGVIEEKEKRNCKQSPCSGRCCGHCVSGQLRNSCHDEIHVHCSLLIASGDLACSNLLFMYQRRHGEPACTVLHLRMLCQHWS